MKLSFATYDHWLTRQDYPHILAIFRIAFGLFLLLYAGLYAPHIEVVFTDAGISIPFYIDTAPAWLAPALSLPSAPVAWTLYALLMLALISFTLGFYSRISTFFVAVLGLYFWQLSLHLFPTSYNRIFFFILIVLIFTNTGATFSLSQKLKTGSWVAWEPISIFSQRILALQLSITYFGVGLQKVILPLWQGGEVLPYSFQTRWGTWLAYDILQLNIPLFYYDLFVESIIIFEVLLPFLLWNRRWRWPFIIGTVLFHGGITILLGIWWFLVLIPANILYFEPKEVVEYLKRTIRLKV